MKRNIFKPCLWTISLLTVMLFLLGGVALSATQTPSEPRKALNDTVAPSSSKPGASITGPSSGTPGPGVSSKTLTSNPNAAPSSCPLDLSAAPKGDIRDIRGPIHIPDPRLWLFYILGAILLALLAWAAWQWFGKRQPFRSKTAFEIAFEELEKAKALMMPEMAERFSVMVSTTIRTYIEKRFRMRATRKTTHEFITQVATEPNSELNQHTEPLRNFLVHCDLAKFARQTFTREQMEEMHQSAWRFVEETRPQPVQKEVEESASTVNGKAMGKKAGKGTLGGKKRLFKGKGNSPWFPGKDNITPGFDSARQPLAAGGR